MDSMAVIQFKKYNKYKIEHGLDRNPCFWHGVTCRFKPVMRRVKLWRDKDEITACKRERNP